MANCEWRWRECLGLLRNRVTCVILSQCSEVRVVMSIADVSGFLASVMDQRSIVLYLHLKGISYRPKQSMTI
jgi:hypothetical protein